MRHLIFTLGLLLPLLSFAQEEIEYKEYSYSQFFQMIEDEQDSIFELKDALIIPDESTDSLYFAKLEVSNDIFATYPKKDSVVINKALILNNVNFPLIPSFEGQTIYGNLLSYIHFKKLVTLINVSNFILAASTFDEHISVAFTREGITSFNQLQTDYSNIFILRECIFKKGIDAGSSIGEDRLNVQFGIVGSRIYSSPKKALPLGNNVHTAFQFDSKIWNFTLYKNRFIGKGTVYLNVSNPSELEIVENIFENEFVRLPIQNLPKSDIRITGNDFRAKVGLSVSGISENAFIGWTQFNNKSISFNSLGSTLESLNGKDPNITSTEWLSDENVAYYFDKLSVENTEAYKKEQKVKGQFYKHYKEQNDIEFANMVYVDTKDHETRRMAFLYKSNRTFKAFFSWKINQFLKVFSAYGTEPARAIIFSMYVILAFALVYLFFPNHWDSHGKNRIMDRYRFFTKYMKRDSGMHEVYLEEKNQELMASEDFKSYMLESEKGVPKFFMATALPLYRWSVAGTKSASWLLSKVDVLKGKWSETEDSKKGGKSFLLITAFLIALLYDIFIKMLNALMLSINTFTTLGFGEIPIKGLPRYLAIIQGFIGWFMLTIFSVSLISQLLN